VSGAARQAGHEINITLTSIMMLIVIGYVAYHSRTRFGSHWQVFGPLYLTIVSSLLILADPTRHMLLDFDIWPADYLSEYRDDCDDESIACLSVVGWIFTIGCTYTGFIILTLATLWNANIIDKIDAFKDRWRQLRQSSHHEDVV